MNAEKIENLELFSKSYPFKSQFLEIGKSKKDSLRIHYLDEGPKEAECVLCVHGNPTWSFYYRKIVEQFSRTHRVIALDHIGCGLSDKPENYNYTLDNHIKNLENLVKELGLKNITLIVHDWGGPIGIGFAQKNLKLIKRLVILNTACFEVKQFPWYLRFLQIKPIGAIAIRGMNLFCRIAAIVGCTDDSLKNEEIRQGYLGPYNNYKNRIAILRFVEDIPFTKSHQAKKTVENIENNLNLLENIETHIFWGTKDPVFHLGFLAKWRDKLKKAKVRELNAGHYVLEEANEEILKELKGILCEKS